MLDATRCSLILALLASACASSTAGTEANRLAIGAWGGEHLLLTVTAEGAHLEFDCASGDIARPLVVNSNGDLAVEGVFFPVRGGPVRANQTPEGKPARYAGHLKGDTLTLEVVLTESKESLGSFAVTLGAAPRLTRCR